MSSKNLIQKRVFIAIGGPSGAGKTTIIEKLKNYFGDQIYKTITYTTRSPRVNEVDGMYYHFVETSEMAKYQNNHRYINFVSARGNWYWIDSFELFAEISKSINGIYLAATTQVREFTELKNIFSNLKWIWLTAENDELYSRLKTRGDNDITQSLEHNKLLEVEKKDRANLISIELDTTGEKVEATLNRIIQFIKKI